MELTEWQITLIATAVGSAVPLILIVVREIYQERKLGHKVRNILIGELSSIQETLNEALAKGIVDENDKEHLNIQADMSLYDSFPLDTTYYDDMEIETLATYLKADALKSLQKLYRVIYDYNQSYMRFYGGHSINIKDTNDLLEKIGQYIKVLN